MWYEKNKSGIMFFGRVPLAPTGYPAIPRKKAARSRPVAKEVDMVDATLIQVSFFQYGNDKLISRSQAKRVLARIELFKRVIFDFTEVTFIGQAFADEIFRVFSLQHPDIDLQYVHANREVMQMINRAKSETLGR